MKPYSGPVRRASRRRDDRLPGAPVWLGMVLLGVYALGYWLWSRRQPQPTGQSPAGTAASFPPSRRADQSTNGDLQISDTLRSMGIVAGVVLFSVVIALGLLMAFGSAPPAIADLFPTDLSLVNVDSDQRSPIPELPPETVQERVELTELAQERLNSYGWVSQDDGIVHIPLERAINLAVEQGLPTRRPTATPGAATPTAAAGDATPDPTPTPDPTAAANGAQLFGSLGCDGCHPGGQAGTGPSLVGLLGRQVELQSGETISADLDYVRRSILRPDQQIVAGYNNVMPSFEEQLDDRELAQLIAYIRALQP